MSEYNNTSSQKVIFGRSYLSLSDIAAVARGNKQAELDKQTSYKAMITKGNTFLETLLKEEGVIYGVTTGYGDSCTVSVPAHLVEDLPTNLYRFHGCGLGNYFSPELGMAILATRMTSLAKGYSGVRYELLQGLERLINEGIVPLIPEEGSVGASGDLTPLSYVAAVLCGERQVWYQGKVMDTAKVFELCGIEALRLRPKEGLAIMNGTAVMTAVACMAWERAAYLSQLVSRISSLTTIALQGNAYHFDEKLFSVKPHAGQNKVAEWIRKDLQADAAPRNSDRLQCRYSVRCAPHIIGVLEDALPFFKQTIENELNSANDNPIIDGEGEHVLHGGHFYGGHIAFVMDSMKNTVANLADLLDRQMAQLMDVRYNNGLPANLSGSSLERAMINHGFKAVQIGTSAWTAEALKLTMPASVFSRSTECHNQDKVSMGTISARDCMRVLELTEQVAAAVLLAATQGVELRIRQGELKESELTEEVLLTRKEVFDVFDFLDEDRPLEMTLRDCVSKIQQKHWALYE